MLQCNRFNAAIAKSQPSPGCAAGGRAGSPRRRGGAVGPTAAFCHTGSGAPAVQGRRPPDVRGHGPGKLEVLLRIFATVPPLLALPLLLAPGAGAAAAEEAAGHAPHLDGGALGLLWTAPFVGILLSIAIFPLLAPSFWHHHFGKLSAAWAAAFLVPFADGLRLRPGPLRDAAHAAARVRAVHHPAARAVHDHRRPARAHQPAGHALLQHRHPRLRHLPRQLDRHHRCRDAADPPAAARQRLAARQDARRGVLHLPGRQHRRLADAARRSAAVPRLSQGRRLLLADARDVFADAGGAR